LKVVAGSGFADGAACGASLRAVAPRVSLIRRRACRRACAGFAGGVAVVGSIAGSTSATLVARV
jgi:hypothetical protein